MKRKRQRKTDLQFICDRWFKFIGKGVALITLALQVSTERKRLARLTDRELADIGIDRAGALHECSRSSFDLPSNRLPILGHSQRRNRLESHEPVVSSVRYRMVR